MGYYEDFMNDLQEQICRRIGIPKSDMNFIKKSEQGPSKEDRLIVTFKQHEKLSETCGFHTQYLFQCYQTNTSMQQIIMNISEQLEDLKSMNVYSVVKDIKNYEKIKSRLYIRLLNVNKNEKELKDALYRQIGDIALTLYLKISEDKDSTVSTKIYRDVFNNWKKDENEVFQIALENTYLMSPPKLFNLEKLIEDFYHYPGEDFMNQPCEIEKSYTGNCITTALKKDGAVTIFLPGVAKRLASLMNSDFYIVFTSIHEAMIHDPVTSTVEDLSEVLTGTINEATSEKDFLSYNIYYYNKESGEFACLTHNK